jgi:prevent-host-death family protein
VGLFEAKQKLSELVERAAAGERIGITRRGKLAAIIVSVTGQSFELKDRVTERERSNITTSYYDIATGELEKATEGYKQWTQTYPRDAVVRGNLSNDFMVAG